MKYLNQYNKIMERYTNGDFGDKNLTMYEILNAAEAHELLSNMNLNELQILANNSYNITKIMFQHKYRQKHQRVSEMKKMENELLSYELGDYYISGILDDLKLAENLKLEIEYVPAQELPDDVEAMLSPCENTEYNGLIKVLEDLQTKFSYMHEIMHYFRDVGVGNRVQKTYMRKKKGELKHTGEQEIDYLAAAASMPLESIKQDLIQFEEVYGEDEKIFINKMVDKYQQEYDAILRRFVEVRSLI